MFHWLNVPQTLIARAVASECNASVHVINGAEVVGALYGESEQRIRAVFDEALKEPRALVFIDEIDVLCGTRGEVRVRTMCTLAASRLVRHLKRSSYR